MYQANSKGERRCRAYKRFTSNHDTLSPSERFELATLLLKDIPPHSVVDYSTEWSDEDLRDFTRAGQFHIEQILVEEENHA